MQSTKPVAIQATQFAHCGFLRRQSIGHGHGWDIALVPLRSAQESHGRSHVPALLYQDIGNFASLAGVSPDKHPFASDPHDHLGRVPLRIRTLPQSANVGGDRRTELVHPAVHGLVAHIDPALGEQVFDVARAEREATIEPDCRLYDQGRKTGTLEGNGFMPIDLGGKNSHLETSCGWTESTISTPSYALDLRLGRRRRLARWPGTG